ncbi:DUF1310 family protein [Convivina intestini]|uniref:DUF1310 family protein n=1 Tax=Convivina intestini TaxID=1505726 RepID=UPI0020102D11|nr:DUF1310 family protein [Convivina intestini]CAH1857142.1 hypothetical protein R078131_01539 [Convivina intestini]
MINDDEILRRIDERNHQRKKRWLLALSVIFVVFLISVGIGVKIVSDKQQAERVEHTKMVKIVEEHKGEIEDWVCEDDKHNFVKKITIDQSRTEHNPMGGVNFYGYVNGDESLGFNGTIGKGSSGIHVGSMGFRKKLSDNFALPSTEE